MPSASELLAVALVLFALYALAPDAKQRAIRHLPAAASALPLVGDTLSLLGAYRGRLYDFYYHETLRQGGRMWRMKVLGRDVAVVLTTPEAVEYVLKTRFEDFGKGPVMTATMHDLMGDGIFAVDGARWAHQRKTATRLFSLRSLRGGMEQGVREHTAVLCDRLETLARSGETVNVKRTLDLFTMDVFAKIGFGVDIDSQRAAENPPFLDAFERASRHLLTRLQGPMWLWQIKKWLNVGSEKAMAEDLKTLNALAYEIISRSMERRQQACHAQVNLSTSEGTAKSADGAPGNSDSRDLISLFLEKESFDDASGEQSRTDATLIRDMTVNFVAAGRDTTSQSMTWLLLMLNRHPRVLKKIREEIAAKLPGLANGAIRVPGMEDVAELTYLEAAIRESLRLNPVVAANSRTALCDTTLHDGTFIKKGTRVAIPIYAFGRLKTIWGDSALEYKPERWLDPATGGLVQESPFKFLAFLGGPRICIGMKFAFLEMKIAMATVLSKFEVKTVKDPFDFTYQPSLTMTIKGPVEVVVTPLAASK